MLGRSTIREIASGVIVAVVAFIALFSSTSPSDAHPGHYWKKIYPDRWYQQVSDTGSYASWMTLSTHIDYNCGPGCQSKWQLAATQAMNSWNTLPTTVYLADYGFHNIDHDLSIVITATGCDYTHAGSHCTQGAGVLGQAYLRDEARHECDLNKPPSYGDCDTLHSRPNTWWYAILVINDYQFSGKYSQGWFMQGIIAHEIGHALSLDHETLFDGQCGIPGMANPSIMDYECLELYHNNAPVSWDACGINHAYYDPNWGYSGC